MNFPLLACSTTPDGWSCRISIPGEHPVFDGHFPGRPVLPAIAHLAVAAQALAAVTGREASISAVPFLRLRRPVAPGDVLDVSISRPAADGSISFDIRRGEEWMSSGFLVVMGGK
jgi:3-hydroxyacyl-[acyl-carrier-protein] dehydratase